MSGRTGPTRKLDAQDVATLLADLPRDSGGRPVLDDADFAGARFSGDIRFENVVFSGPADFAHASFEGAVVFRGCKFEGPSDFDGADFQTSVDFTHALFKADASFKGATLRNALFGTPSPPSNDQVPKVNFEGLANFSEAHFEPFATFSGAWFRRHATFALAEFHGPALFSADNVGPRPDGRGPRGVQLLLEQTFFDGATFKGATFHDAAYFRWTTFAGWADFDEARFTRVLDMTKARFEHASFRGASFGGELSLSRTTFVNDVGFTGAHFAVASEVGPCLARSLILDEIEAQEHLRVDVTASAVTCIRPKLSAGMTLSCRFADLFLDEVRVGALFNVTPAQPVVDRDCSIIKEPRTTHAAYRREEWSEAAQPALVSMRRTDAENIFLTGVDLSRCRFDSVYRLDALRMERSRFAESPRVGLGPLRLGPRREVLAEEGVWRRAHGDPRWAAVSAPIDYPRDLLPEIPGARPRTHADVADARVLDAAEVASLYRALRKSREDQKDEPGGADFYYGEMEMRRYAASSTERLLLTAYWLVSGYGLRSLRAVTALAITTLTAGVALYLFGITSVDGDDPSLARSLFYSLESTTSLFRVPELPRVQLNYAGEAIQIALRLLGPLFFGLALLALRGRVRR